MSWKTATLFLHPALDSYRGNQQTRLLMIRRVFQITQQSVTTSIGLLPIRLVAGLAFIIHGSGKIQNPFGWMGPDAPTPGILQALAALSEFGGGFAWIVGFLTPLASFGIACTMTVAVYYHAALRGDPFVSVGGSSYELASIYLCVAILLILAGPGRYSLDRAVFGERE